MNEEQKHQLIKDTLSAEVKKKLYLYSYIGLLLLAIINILFAAISLVLDSNLSSDQHASMICSYVALGFAGLNLLFLAILSAFYFVQGDEEPSLKRIRGVSLLRIFVRFVNLGVGVSFLVSTYLGLAGGSEKWWNAFIRGWSIVLIVIEGLMFLYALWKNAWIKENPERYLTPVYPLSEKTTSLKKKESNVPAKKAAAKNKTIALKNDVIEVPVEPSETKRLPSEKK